MGAGVRGGENCGELSSQPLKIWIFEGKALKPVTGLFQHPLCAKKCVADQIDAAAEFPKYLSWETSPECAIFVRTFGVSFQMEVTQ